MQRTWRFYRFLQHEFDADHLAIPRDVAAVLKDHADLLKQYRAINAFYGRLTNPLVCLPVDALIDATAGRGRIGEAARRSHAAVALFPPSTSRETELFERLFPDGLPADANLMVTLIRRIRSGEVDLKPSAKPGGDGWYQYQVYALETMLLPGRGQENEKLLLTAEYKKRLVEAFKAMITTRRETHARQLSRESVQRERSRAAKCRRGCESSRARRSISAPPGRTPFCRISCEARSAASGSQKLHGLKQGGTREATLDAELDALAPPVLRLLSAGLRRPRHAPAILA